LADPSVQAVHVLGRRKPGGAHARITAHIVDFAALLPLPPVDEVYLALGATIKVAAQAAFRAIEFDANLAVARASLEAGARRCGLVSAMGANAKSSAFYNRVKGELEEALAQLPFEGLVIARPSLLVGNRASLGQPERPLEKVSAVFMKIFGPLIPANYRAIDAAKVAQTLLGRTPAADGGSRCYPARCIGASSREGLTRGSLRVTSPASSSHATCAGSISTGSETKRKMSRSAPSTGLSLSSSVTRNINKLRCDTLITRGEPENCSIAIRTVSASFSTESGTSATLNSRSARNQ
jgi:hypothetical protein